MSKHIPALYDYSTAANIYCYLLSSLGWASKEILGLKGLVLIFDEAEAVDLYQYAYQHGQSHNFLSALIRVASNDQSLLGSPHSAGLRYCKKGKGTGIPFLYRPPSSLKLVFSFTPGYTFSTLPELQTPRMIELKCLEEEALKGLYEEVNRVYDRAYRFRTTDLSFEAIVRRVDSQEAVTRRFLKATIEALDLARMNPGLSMQDLLEKSVLSQIPRLLKYAWLPFFGSFGGLKPVQIDAIPRILQGNNVVISAPTASGKTEAVVAPVAERLVREYWKGLSVLYITPTRALGNDLLLRLQGSLKEMGITTRLKHGDTPYLPTRDLPNFLITTPESLDSMLCRRTQVLKNVRTLILDEIHLIDGTYRGDQLLVLIARLRKIADDPNFSVHVLSATLADPEDVGSHYTSSYDLVTVPGQRTMELHIVKSVSEVHTRAMDRGFKKILCFCNSRQSVEKLASAMDRLWHPYPVFAHHGSLGPSLRSEAERTMKQEDVAVCVATSTLEIGIDIGDIDLIVLGEVPWSLSSFVQRIGRGKRRADLIEVAAIAESDMDEFVLKEMAKAIEKGELDLQLYEPDISVAVQQIFSYLFQHTQGVSEMELLDLVNPLCSDDDGKLVLTHLEKEEWIQRLGDCWVATEKMMDKAQTGSIHANIPTPRILRVVDVDSGKEVGEISGQFDEFFVLGQRRWQTVWADDKVAKVRRVSGDHGPARFRRHREVGAFFFYLPPELQLWPEPF